MGNCTVAIVSRDVKGTQQEVVADITLSSSYATNGDTIVANDIALLLPDGYALTDLETVDLSVKDGATGHGLVLDRTNKKVKAYNGTTEIAAATNLSAVIGRLTARFGRRTGRY